MDQDQFYRVLDAVEHAGGQHLSGSCKGQPTEFEDRNRNGRRVKVRTHACHKEMRIQLPYEGIEQKEGLPAKHEGFVVACAEGDMVANWPRVQEAS